MTTKVVGPKTAISYVDDALELWRESGIRIEHGTSDDVGLRDAALDQMVAAVERAMAAAHAEGYEAAKIDASRLIDLEADSHNKLYGEGKTAINALERVADAVRRLAVPPAPEAEPTFPVMEVSPEESKQIRAAVASAKEHPLVDLGSFVRYLDPEPVVKPAPSAVDTMPRAEPGLLSSKNIDHDSGLFRYIVELHDVLWEFSRIIHPGTGGALSECVPAALAGARELRARADKAEAERARLEYVLGVGRETLERVERQRDSAGADFAGLRAENADLRTRLARAEGARDESRKIADEERASAKVARDERDMWMRRADEVPALRRQVAELQAEKKTLTDAGMAIVDEFENYGFNCVVDEGYVQNWIGDVRAALRKAGVQ